jgi:hypothetical protein
MRRFLSVMLLAAVSAALPCMVSATPLAQTGCQFTDGFRVLREQLGDVVGECVENARPEPSTGNVLQRTTGGLMVWRARGNWTAFTDGSHTWLIGPFGLQQRGSTERFDWEEVLAPIAPTAPPVAPAPQAVPGSILAPASQAPPPAPAPATCAPGPINDDPSRAAPLTGSVAGTLGPAIWSRSSDQPDRPAFLYYAFQAGANQFTYVGISVADDGGYKVRANVYAPDGSHVGSVLIGARERQEIAFAAPQTGTYVLQLSNFRPADVQFHVDLRSG